MSARFDAAIEVLSRPHLVDEDLTDSVLVAIPMSGAAVSTLGRFLGSETVSASDEIAARIDELQLDLGEGPCWDSVDLGRPILEPDIRNHPRRNWPAFSDALREEQVGALFAFPLSIGAMHIGALDLYNERPAELPLEQAEQVAAITDLISRHVLRRAVRLAGNLEEDGQTRHSRRTIHQATGFVIAQLGISAEDAHALIQGQALTERRSMRAIADDIVSRRLTFRMVENRIEDVR
ncbi:GAF and ANTAR domain-containing protein [Agromyces sp. NPDC057865]|uniref:GAF and ANTAR domain-containing protein n=1 Tax=Agromyces sp. NPDC057865 TaxID=3346267 RepID=UPI00366C9060